MKWGTIPSRRRCRLYLCAMSCWFALSSIKTIKQLKLWRIYGNTIFLYDYRCRIYYVRCWWASHEDKGVGSVNCVNCFLSCFVVVLPVDVRLCGYSLRWLWWQVFLVSWAVQVPTTKYCLSFVGRLRYCLHFIALLWREKFKEGGKIMRKTPNLTLKRDCAKARSPLVSRYALWAKSKHQTKRSD